MSIRADAETLRRIPIFQNCDPVALQILAFASERMPAGIGDRLLTQGERTDCAYLVLSGEIAVVSDGVDIGLAEPGTFLGETAMIGGSPSSVTAEARSLAYVAKVSHEVFLKVAREYPEFGQAVLQAISSRVSSTLRDYDLVREYLVTAKAFADIKQR